MAEEQRTICKYCNSDHTDLEYRLHRLSNPHVRKVKAELLQCEFSSACRVCMIGFRSLEDVEIHIQGAAHSDKLASHFSASNETRKCTCELCGVLFHNDIALEAHRLMPSHRNVADSHTFPKLDELLRQLSGLHGEHLALHITSTCSICNVEHDGLDAYILHLFTTMHMSHLRFSSCLLCTKEFVHADNRELHLVSSKHASNLQKYSLNPLEEPLRFSPQMKGGYPCMICMVWCSSWLCLELHLQYTNHAHIAQQRGAKRPVSAKITFAIPEGDQDNAVCDADAAMRWKDWRQNPLQEDAWCHKCAMSLPTLDVSNAHSEKHNFGKDVLAMHATHAHESPNTSSMPTLFDCCMCALSFKSALLLAAHEASFQHHCRMRRLPVVDDLPCCASCGVLMSKKDNEEVYACNGTDVIPRHENGKGHGTVGLCSSSLEMKDPLCKFDPLSVKEERLSMECSDDETINPLVFPNRNGSRKLEKNAGMMLIQAGSMGTEEVKNSMQKRPFVATSLSKTDNERGALPLACAGHVDNGVQQDSRIPVIAAAALVPLGAFDQPLHSITTILVQALSAASPTYMQNPASSSEENRKRNHQKDQECLEGQQEAKKACLEETMQETVHNIIQSVCSNSASIPMEDKSMDTTTVLAVAASIIPKFLPVSCGAASVQGGDNIVIETQHGFATEGNQQVCEAADMSTDMKLCIGRSLKGNHCANKKLCTNYMCQPPLMQNSERAMEMLPAAAKNVVQGIGKESPCHHEDNEEPALANMDVGTPSTCIKRETDVDKSSMCIKSEKAEDHDNKSSPSILTQFKEADLWWVRSDSEDGF